MTAPVSRLANAESAVSSIADALRAGELVDAHLERTASRRLSVVAPATRRLQANDGTFGGYLRVERNGSETYAPVGNASPAGLARALSVSRRARHLGRPTPDRRPARHSPAAGRWQNTPERFDVRAVDARLVDAVGAELARDQRITAMDVTELLRRVGVRAVRRAPHGSVTYGVEVAVAVGNPAAVVSRYAATADRLDLRGLGRGRRGSRRYRRATREPSAAPRSC